MGIEHFLPAMQALHIGTPSQALGNLFPIFAIVALHSPGELLVLLRRPVALVGSVLVLGGASFVNTWVMLLALDNFQLGLHQEFLSAGACAYQRRHQRSLVVRGKVRVTLA